MSRDYAYREVRATLEQAQDQQRRYRQALLDSMRCGQPIYAEELALLARNPLATALLERLILMDEAGAVGLFRADDGSLEGRHGERVRITGTVVVAHPYALAQAGPLTDWQESIVQRRITQPFKQVFRELYLLTPAEAHAGYESGRLAGRRLKSRQALAVLANLGWIVDRYGTVQKPFYGLGYAAHFTTGGYDDDDAEAHATTSTLAFWPLNHQSASGGTERRIKLVDVPHLLAMNFDDQFR